jgi:hypothetical protein
MNFFQGISMIDANTATVVGDKGAILRTTDGGVTWTSQKSGTTKPLRDVCFTDASTGTVVGLMSTVNGTADIPILRTTDGGATWVSQVSGTSWWLYGVSFTDANTGTVVGSRGTILRTSNGGDTWDTQTSGTTSDLYGVSFVDALTGTAVGVDGTILFTVNGGLSWIRSATVTDMTLWDVSFTDPKTGTAVGDLGTILRSEDDVQTAVMITGFCASPVTDGIELGWSLTADESIDGFQLIRSRSGHAGEYPITEQLIGSSERSYVDTTALPGNRYRYTLLVWASESGIIRSAPVEVERPPLAVRLFQNHPNPFNPTTTIRFVVPRASHVTLRVYSPAGKLVRTLVDRVLHSGTREAIWDGTNDIGNRVASGVYFCRLRVDRVYLSHKMILLK